MPPARSAAARSPRARAAVAPDRASRPTPRPRRVPLRSSVVRVRWERVGRIALLVVLGVVVVLYAEHAISYVSTRRAATHARAGYVQLAREHRALLGQARSLREPSTIVARARQLGMVRDGEQPFVVPTR